MKSFPAFGTNNLCRNLCVPVTVAGSEPVGVIGGILLLEYQLFNTIFHLFVLPLGEVLVLLL